jgi:hypothetical protein
MGGVMVKGEIEIADWMVDTNRLRAWMIVVRMCGWSWPGETREVLVKFIKRREGRSLALVQERWI